MKVYKLVYISALFIVLSGCSVYSSHTEKKEEPKVIKNEPVVLDITHKKKEEKSKEEQMEFYEVVIDEQVTSPIGESKSYFTNYGSSKVKVSLLNIGTESFQYSIRNVDDERRVANGILKNNESYEQVFDNLPEGAYLISYVVEEETSPINIALSVKVELGR